jgi:hypothetical protein
MNPSARTVRLAAVAGLALLMLAAGPQLRAQTFDLVTAAEAQQAAQAEAAAPPADTRPRTRSLPRPQPTSIRVLAPSTTASPVPAPLRIELAFSPAPGARIVPATFRILYGVLKIDLTERLRKHATITEAGVLVEGAQVPDGQHRLLLQVADDQGNLAEQELRIRVGTVS